MRDKDREYEYNKMIYLSIDRLFFSTCTHFNPLVYGFHCKNKKNKYPVLRYDQIQEK